MPELPEVEVAARNLRRWATGRRIARIEALPTQVLRPHGPGGLTGLMGARIEAVERRGKNLLLVLDAPSGALGMLCHLGMTGKWTRRPVGAEVPRATCLSLELAPDLAPALAPDLDASAPPDPASRCVLHFVDPRRFGRFHLAPSHRMAEIPELAALGPDPLVDGIDPARLREDLRGRRSPIKVALLDQALLAGVGNIQASEALFRAGIDPRRAAGALAEAELPRLAAGVVGTIADTLADFHAAHYDEGDGVDVAYLEDGAPNTFRVYGRAGEPCPRCAGGAIGHDARIERIVQAGRSTFFCATCQR